MPYAEHHRKEKERERCARRKAKYVRKGYNPKSGHNLPILRGKEHPRWKGGLHRSLNTKEYKKWRSAVFERDNWACQTCGLRGVRLEAHHIKTWAEYPEFRFVVENGVTLCKDCHKLIKPIKSKEVKNI